MSAWENLEPKLLVPSYWSSKTCVQWSAEDFCFHILQKNSSYNKKSAMSLFSTDLEVIRLAFAHNNLISSRVGALVKQASKKDELLDQFWRNYAGCIKSIALKRKYNVAVTGGILEDEAITGILEQQRSRSKNIRISISSISSSKPTEDYGAARGSDDDDAQEDDGALQDGDDDAQEDDGALQDGDDDAPSQVENSNPQSTDIEHDNVNISSSSLSVGTIIKREALRIYGIYASSLEKCPVDDRKVMTNGLSSILDLCDQSINSQQRLFNVKQWQELLDRFSHLKQPPSFLKKEVLNTICIITNCSQTQLDDIASALLYLKVMQDQAKLSEDIFQYKLIKHSLKLLRDYPLMLIKNPPIDCTESDYLYVLWMKIFKSMFPPKQSLVRIKTGESVFSVSTEAKKDLYPDNKDVRGFKIDIRFIVDVGGKEIDVAAAEAAKDDSKDKILNDQAKLSREGKDIIDNLVDIVDAKTIKSCRAYLFQIACSECVVSSISLASNGLYVVVHQNNISLPCSPQEFNDDFTSSLSFLSSCREEMESLAAEVKCKATQKINPKKVLGLEQPRKVYEHIHWTRGTFYSPPPKTVSAVPFSLFGTPPPNILAKLKSAYKDTGRIYKKVEEEDNDLEGYDMYGWRRREDGMFYNKYIKTAYNEHPMKIKK